MAGPVSASLSSRLSQYVAENFPVLSLNLSEILRVCIKPLKSFIYNGLRCYTGVRKFIINAFLISQRKFSGLKIKVKRDNQFVYKYV